MQHIILMSAAFPSVLVSLAVLPQALGCGQLKPTLSFWNQRFPSPDTLCLYTPAALPITTTYASPGQPGLLVSCCDHSPLVGWKKYSYTLLVWCIRALSSPGVTTSFRSPLTWTEMTSRPQSLCYAETAYLFPINQQDFCAVSSHVVVALENYPGMTQQSWRADEMGTHTTLLLWCNMALVSVYRENKQLSVICGGEKSPQRGTSCTKKEVQDSS